MTCAWFELLSRIPFTGLRLRLCAWHAEQCPRCLQTSESMGTPPRLVTADQLPVGLDLWPGVKYGIEALRRPAGVPAAMRLPAGSAWRWACAAAMLLLAVFAGYLAFFLGRGMQPHPGSVEQRTVAQTRLCSARIGDKPARIFRIQSRNPDRTIFWIAKSENRS